MFGPYKAKFGGWVEEWGVEEGMIALLINKENMGTFEIEKSMGTVSLLW